MEDRQVKQKFLMPDGELVEKDMPQWKTPWNHDTNFESDRTALFCKEPSLTKQEFKDECDINVILERFLKTGEPPAMTLPEDFADISERRTYMEIAEQFAEARSLFYGLPAGTRESCNNDPAFWADQVVKAMDKRDGDRLNELGVAIPERMAAKLPPQPEPPKQPEGGTPAPSGNKEAPSASKGA